MQKEFVKEFPGAGAHFFVLGHDLRGGFWCLLAHPGRVLGALGLVLEAPGSEHSQNPRSVAQIQGGQGGPGILRERKVEA